MKMPNEPYITSTEGEKLLGINTGRFFYYVNSNQIAREPGSTKRNARYSVEDMLKVKEKLANKQEKARKRAVHGHVDWIASVEDVLNSLKLDYRVYGENTHLGNLDYYAARVARNPQVAFAVYDSPKRENILAYVSLLPLPEQVILEVLRGARDETDIRAEEVETYDRPGGFTLLAESVVTDPAHPELLNTLLRYLVRFWCGQYPDRYITKVYAQAETREGDILIQKLFMSPREDLAPNAHVLNLTRPGASRFVKEFQKCIEEKRQALESEQGA